MPASRTGEGLAAARRDLVEAILAGEVTRAAAARELGVSTEAIRRWVARERSIRFVAVRWAGGKQGP